jgi:hypothetical protein
MGQQVAGKSQTRIVSEGKRQGYRAGIDPIASGLRYRPERGSVVSLLQARRSRVRFPMRSFDFSFQPPYDPDVHSASNRNDYQESS